MGKSAKVDQGAVNSQADANAAKQQQFNTQNAQTQAAYNRPNQTNAFGNNVSWAQTGTDANGAPTFTQTQSLGDMGQAYARGLTGLGQQYFNMAGQGAPDSTAALDRAEQFATARLDRQRGLDTDALDNKLKNQGLQPGTQAYDEAMRSMLNSYGDRRDAMTANLQNQFYGQGLQTRQQQMSELQPGLNFAQYALNTNQAGFSPINISNVDFGSMQNSAFNQQNEMVKQENARQQAMMGGLASLGGALIGGPMGAMAGQAMFGGGGQQPFFSQPGSYMNGGWSTQAFRN